MKDRSSTKAVMHNMPKGGYPEGCWMSAFLEGELLISTLKRRSRPLLRMSVDAPKRSIQNPIPDFSPIFERPKQVHNPSVARL